jgi:1-deoxyxylulose-5-phosphate synthase
LTFDSPASPRTDRLVDPCMSFGDPKRGAHPWTLDEESSRPLIRQALEEGINFFDTAKCVLGR